MNTLQHPTVTQSIVTAKKNLGRYRSALARCTRNFRKIDYYQKAIAETVEMLARLEEVPENERNQPYFKWFLAQDDE